MPKIKTPMTTKNPFNTFRTLKRIVLSSELKERMRADLSAYADLHAIQNMPARVPVRSPYVFSSFMARSRSLYAGALALVLMVAGGTQASFAAEGSVPGDILYPLKVAVSEPLSFVLTPSAEGRAGLAAQFASRRVDEAAALSSVGKLDEKTADELATRFDVHVDVLAQETDTLEAKGEIAASLAVRTDLEQKLSSRVEEFLVDEVAENDVAVMVAVEDESTVDRFTARVFEKSKTLATTRERLEAALALDLEAAEAQDLNLDLLTPEEGEPARLFFADDGSGAAATSVMVDGQASTTATTTEEVAPEESAASRFFAPFLKR